MAESNHAQGKPVVEVVMAMSADGKIADAGRSPQRIASPRDRAVLDSRLAVSDAVLYGAGTLRALRRGIFLSPEWPHPPANAITNIVASTRAEFDLDMPFFAEAGAKWLVCAEKPASEVADRFDEVLVAPGSAGVDWRAAMSGLAKRGVERICCGGGGGLCGALAKERLIDDYWITIAPLFIGGQAAPTPVDGEGHGLGQLSDLQLLSHEVVDGEVFLHYRTSPGADTAS